MNGDLTEWHKIGNRLCFHLKICSCQRKLKSFVDMLVEIHRKIGADPALWHELTPQELIVTAMLDQNTDLITHGTNCEYPFLGTDSRGFWPWLLSIKDSPHLEDN